MELIRMLVDFRGILLESAKVLCITGKVMVISIPITPITYSLCYLFNLLVLNKTGASFMSYLKWIFLLINAASWSLFAAATVVQSAIAYSGGNTLPFKNLLLLTSRTWKKPLATIACVCFLFFYFTFYNFFTTYGSPFFLALNILFNESSIAAFDVVSILFSGGFLICFCFSVEWIMGLVVSVLEDTYGFGAMRKGRELVKGLEMWVHGVFLNTLLVVLGLVVYVGMRMVMIGAGDWPEAIPVVMGLVVLTCLWFVGLFLMVVYTILYVKCKKIRGEEIEILTDKEATEPLISEVIVVV